MKKKTIVLTLLIASLLFGIYNFFQKSETESYKKEAMLLIEKVEDFKRQKGKLPSDINNLVIKEEMDGGPNYEKLNSEDYIIYFNIGFDDRLTYYSKGKIWKHGFDK